MNNGSGSNCCETKEFDVELDEVSYTSNASAVAITCSSNNGGNDRGEKVSQEGGIDDDDIGAVTVLGDSNVSGATTTVPTSLAMMLGIGCLVIVSLQ